MKRFSGGEKARTKGGAICAICDKNLSEPRDSDVGPHGAWPTDWPVNHCEGGRAFNARNLGVHHTRFPLHPPCVHCGTPMGCSKCAGPYDDLLCVKCHQWANDTALANHGPLTKRPIPFVAIKEIP